MYNISSGKCDDFMTLSITVILRNATIDGIFQRKTSYLIASLRKPISDFGLSALAKAQCCSGWLHSVLVIVLFSF